MQVTPLPCLADNYAWLLREGDDAVVVDPSEAGPVLAALGTARLRAVWCTHHHWDHVGGIEDLRMRLGAFDIVGSHRDVGRIPHQTRAVGEGDVVEPFGARVVDIPGHTLGAVAYVVDGYLFSGDTLFSAGCGRVFEGTMEQMRTSLAKLRALDPSLRVCCGHEYTVKNLEFAAATMPEDAAVAARLAEARASRERGEPTVPALLSDELRTNLFLRWDDPGVAAAAARLDPTVDAFTALRLAKDRF